MRNKKELHPDISWGPFVFVVMITYNVLILNSVYFQFFCQCVYFVQFFSFVFTVSFIHTLFYSPSPIFPLLCPQPPGHDTSDYSIHSMSTPLTTMLENQLTTTWGITNSYSDGEATNVPTCTL